MSIVQPTISKQDQVTTGKREGAKLVAMKAHQAVSHKHKQRHVTDVMSPAPNANSLNNASQIKYFLEKDTCREIQTIILRFQIRMDTADGTMVPVPYWFNRLEIFDRRKGLEIARYYADTLMLYQSSVTQEQSDSWAPLVNYNPVTYQTDGGATLQQGVGTTKYYYLPLVANVLEGFGLDLTSIDGDIEIRLHPANEGPLNGGNSPGADPQLLEVAGIFSEHAPDVVSRNATRQFMSNHVRSHNYLDTQQYIIPSRAMSPSTKYEFDLDQFDHCSAALVLHIMGNAPPTNNLNGTAGNFARLNDGTIDILGVSGESLYGKGRAVRADYLKDIVVQQHWGSNFIRNNGVYVIPFSDIGKALHGIIDGDMVFDGSKMRLEITTPAGWANTTYEIRIYSLYFRTITQNGSDLSVKDCK
jgi:hypothetical protein